MSRARRSICSCVCLGFVLLLARARVHAGPVGYVSQQRAIDGYLEETYQVIDEGEVRVTNTDGASAPDFSDFDRTIAVEVTPPEGTPLGSGRITVSQHSTLRDDGISASGVLSAIGGTPNAGYEATSNVLVTFELDAPRTFELSFSIDRNPGAQGQTHVTLRPSDDRPPLFDQELDFGGSLPVTGGRSGTLAAGRYEFVFQHRMAGDAPASGDYSVGLALAATGPGPNPVPLPPAAGPGLAILACIVLLRAYPRPDRRLAGGLARRSAAVAISNEQAAVEKTAD